MISNSSEVLLIVLISSVLLVALDADDEDCTTELLVRRNTKHDVVSGQKVRIDCPVLFCNNPPPRVDWYKIEDKHDRLIVNGNNHLRIGWEERKPLEGVSFLIFQKILKNDSGGYQFESEGSVSHTINITLIEEIKVTNKNKAITNNTNNRPKTEPRGIFWMLVYSAGIGSFVVIVVVISVICKLGCKGKSRKEKQTDQWIDNPWTSRDNEALRGPRRQERRSRQRNVTQVEDSSVVYAALNHRLPQREAPRPQREETEYAAICQV